MEYFDTHAHLADERFSSDRAEVVRRAREAGVTRIAEIADGPAEWDLALKLCRQPHDGVTFACALGLHPYHAADFSTELLDDLKSHAKLPEVVAVGEIGLDYAKGSAPREIQLPVFERLLDAARAIEKPAVIHCREAFPDALAALRNLYPSRPERGGFWGVVHCFTGNADQAVELAGLGFALGVDGPVTYPKNEGLRAALKAAGPSVLVLETDSPFLPPQSSRGQRNEPRAIPEIAARLAETLGLPLEELARAAMDNAIALFSRRPGI
jgi:TatD DNase family protein